MPRFFKILNDTECHRGFQFTNGLNIDSQSLTKSFHLPGGLCFTDIENIFRFCSRGPWVREVF